MGLVNVWGFVFGDVGKTPKDIFQSDLHCCQPLIFRYQRSLLEGVKCNLHLGMPLLRLTGYNLFALMIFKRPCGSPTSDNNLSIVFCFEGRHEGYIYNKIIYFIDAGRSPMHQETYLYTSVVAFPQAQFGSLPTCSKERICLCVCVPCACIC